MRITSLALLSASLLGGVATAQAKPFADLDKELTLTLPLWIPASHGTAEVRRFESDIDSSLGDAIESIPDFFDALDFLLLGRAELRIERLIFRASGSLIELSGNKDVVKGLFTLAGQLEVGSLRFEAGYRLGSFQLTDLSPSLPQLDVTTDVLAGLSYTKMSGEFGFARGPSLGGSVDWVDPIAGARLTLAPSAPGPAQVTLEGHVGGGGSNFSWDAKATVDYSLARHMSFSAGWRATGVDYVEERPFGPFRYDVTQHGPLLEFTLRF